MSTTRGRLVQSNQVVLDQADFFMPDGFTRVIGLTVSQLTSVIFFSNVQQPWPLVNGLTVTDEQISSGTVYFNEIPGSPGYYNVRFRPNAVGFWRNLLTYTAGTQIVAQGFDVISSQPTLGGLKASTIKPGKSC